ncbi:MAG: YraN family protein [Pseudomonadota bacterium]
MQKRNRRKSYLFGIVAEYLAAAFLIIKGYSILKIRYRNKLGEIDIIAAKADLLVFIEVKARKNLESAIYSVTPHKQKIILRAANLFTASSPKYAHRLLRFDLIVLTSACKIRHIKDAWRAS